MANNSQPSNYQHEGGPWFPYDRPDRPDRPNRLKKCLNDREDHMETLPRRSQTTRRTETTSIAWIELSSIRQAKR